MPIERYPVGRSGTEREHAKADFADPEAVRTILEEMMSHTLAVDGRIANLEHTARVFLQRNGVSDAPNAPRYSDPTWLRENERKSLVWYSIEILRTADWLRKMIEGGNAKMAADF